MIEETIERLERHGISLSRFLGYSKIGTGTTEVVTIQDTSHDITVLSGTHVDSWHTTIASSANQESCHDVLAEFSLVSGTVRGAFCGIEFDIASWSIENYVLMPASVYNGNRFDSRNLPYAPLLRDPKDIGPDVPTIISDVPRLNNGAGPSAITQMTRDLATPAIGYYSPSQGIGVWLLAPPSGEYGDLSVSIVENEERTRAQISFCSPGIRHPYQYTICDNQRPSNDRGADIEPGDRFSIKVCIFPCSSIQGLFDRFMEVRHSVVGAGPLNHDLPLSEAFSLIESKYNAQNWNEDYGYYRGIGESRHSDWQVGWVGGMMATLPLLSHGSEASVRRSRRNFDFLFELGQAGSGFFHGVFSGGKPSGDGFDEPHAHSWHLTRKSADALYFIIKQLLLMEDRPQCGSVHRAWRLGTRRCADAFVRLWRENGQFGQFVDINTGELIVGGSTSAAIASAGLALAAGFFRERTYLAVAEEAGEYYYNKFIRAGLHTGGPGEILQCPDSESAFGLLESFVTLYEVTGNQLWSVRAHEMARQCATWCVSYDYPFPADSTFGKLKMRTTGTVWANVQNKHSSPGICTLSPLSLFKVFRATGDVQMLTLATEIAHNITQFVSRDDRPICNPAGKAMPSGWINERVNMSDWLEPIGEIFYGSCWPEVSCMLTYTEMPGVYVQTDTDLCVNIDHVETTRVDRDRIKIHNPTRFVAAVSVLAETRRAAMSRHLGQNFACNCPTIHLKPQEAKTVRLSDFIVADIEDTSSLQSTAIYPSDSQTSPNLLTESIA
jgi:hypothetical protein